MLACPCAWYSVSLVGEIEVELQCKGSVFRSSLGYSKHKRGPRHLKPQPWPMNLMEPHIHALGSWRMTRLYSTSVWLKACWL